MPDVDERLPLRDAVTTPDAGRRAPLLRVRDLAIRHVGAEASTPAGAAFEVRPGEVVLVLGPSGCGKSTLTLALNGLIPHDVDAEVTGTVTVAGLEASTTPVSELSTHVGMVFQDPDAQLVTGSVLDEVAFGPENLRIPVAEVLARCEAALRRVGLWDRRHDNPDILSGGGRQRLAIAAALALGSPLLVLDEPTANLDPAGVAEVYRALSEVVAAGDRAIVLVEHNLDQAVRFVHRVVVLDAAGRTAWDGPVDEILRGRAAELHALGVWLPTSTLAALHLRRAGYLLDPLPLTPDELRAGLEASPAVPSGLVSTRSARGATGTETTGTETTAHPASLTPLTPLTPHTPLAPHTPIVERGAQRRVETPLTPVVSTRFAREATGTEAPRIETTGTEAAPTETTGTETTGAPLLKVRGLSLRRGRTEVLHDVSLDVHAGEFVAIVGANGAGKTSLVQAIAGVVRPPRGTVHVGGDDLARIRPRELAARIGFVFQNPEHQFVAHTVHDELAHGLRHVPPAEADERIADVLARFGLTAHADRHPFLLSGGQKRRLSVAAALIAGAPVIALDEPTFGQDRARADELLDLLSALHAAGTTVLVVTHDMQLVTEHATRTVVLGGGRVLADAPTGQVFAAPTLLEQAGLRLPPLREALTGLRSHPELAGITRLADLPGADPGRRR